MEIKFRSYAAGGQDTSGASWRRFSGGPLQAEGKNLRGNCAGKVRVGGEDQ
jgi:hypothetical protein